MVIKSGRKGRGGVVQVSRRTTPFPHFATPYSNVLATAIAVRLLSFAFAT
jgi:hypothetical protein